MTPINSNVLKAVNIYTDYPRKRSIDRNVDNVLAYAGHCISLNTPANSKNISLTAESNG